MARSHSTTGRPAGRPSSVQVVSSGGLGYVPEAPDFLGEDGLSMWTRVWTTGSAYLTEADIDVVTALCELHDEKEYLRRKISIGEIPRFYRVPNGTLVPHPLVNQLKDIRIQINVLFAACGFTPTDRAKMKVMEDIVAKELKTMIEGKSERREARAKQAKEVD